MSKHQSDFRNSISNLIGADKSITQSSIATSLNIESAALSNWKKHDKPNAKNLLAFYKFFKQLPNKTEQTKKEIEIFESIINKNFTHSEDERYFNNEASIADYMIQIEADELKNYLLNIPIVTKLDTIAFFKRLCIFIFKRLKTKELTIDILSANLNGLENKILLKNTSSQEPLLSDLHVPVNGKLIKINPVQNLVVNF